MKRLILLSLCTALLVACQNKPPAPTPNTASSAETTSAPAQAKPKKQTKIQAKNTAEKARKTDRKVNASHRIKEIDSTIAFRSKKVAKTPSSWLDHEYIAKAYMSRARLTGSYEDYTHADNAIRNAFKHAKKGSGPFLTSAKLKLTLHRFKDVQADLDAHSKRIIIPPKQRASVSSMRAELAFAQGKYEKGSEHLREALKIQPNAGNITRMAHIMRILGKRDEARKELDRAVATARKESDFMLAWTLLQRGLIELEEEKLTEAMRFYDEANKAFPDWYLIEEHRAEIFARTKQLKRAEALYRTILKYTPSPEFMNALADVLEEKGDVKEATALRKDATIAYRKQLVQFPQATYSHAFDHFLHTEPKLALELAEKDYALRPGPESTLRLIQARILNGNDKDAAEQIEVIKKTGFSTPEFHATAAWVYTRTKDAERAEKHKKIAEAIAPNSFKELAWLGPKKPSK